MAVGRQVDVDKELAVSMSLPITRIEDGELWRTQKSLKKIVSN